MLTFRAKATDTCTVDNNMPPPEPHEAITQPYRIVIVANPLTERFALDGVRPWDEDDLLDERTERPPWPRPTTPGVSTPERVVRKIGGYEPEPEIVKRAPGIVSTEIGPTGEAAIAYMGGRHSGDGRKKIGPPGELE